MNKFRAEAAKLRKSGYSYTMISRELGIAKSTLSEWLSDEPFTPNKEVLDRIQFGPIKSAAKRHNQRLAETARLRKEGALELGQISKRDLWLLGLGLYIGEGAKKNEQIQFSNADPDAIKIMIRWFIECCGVTRENLNICMHLYPDNNEVQAEAFWKKVTGLVNFRKTYIDRRKNKSKMKRSSLPYGTVHIRVRSNGDPEKGVRLFRRIRGWMDGALLSAD